MAKVVRQYQRGDGPEGPMGYGRLTAAGCVERLCSLTLKGKVTAGGAGWADYVGGLCRKGRQPFGPKVVVSPLCDDEYEVGVTELPSRPHRHPERSEGSR